MMRYANTDASSHQFEIADDNEILKRLGMHKCRKQVIHSLWKSTCAVSLWGSQWADSGSVRGGVRGFAVS